MNKLKDVSIFLSIFSICISCAPKSGNRFSLINPSTPSNANSLASPQDSVSQDNDIPASHPLVTGPLPKAPATSVSPNAPLPADPRGPKVASRCSIKKYRIAVDDLPVEYISSDRERTDRWIELENIGICTRAKSRCTINDSTILIDGFRVEYITNDRERMNRWIELERTGLCTIAKSRCSLKENRIWIDGKPVQYILNEHDLVNRWIELERTRICYDTGRCTIDDLHILIDGKVQESVSSDEERLNRFRDLLNTGFCDLQR